MNQKIMFIALLAALASSLGCRRSSNEPPVAVDQSHATNIYSEAELDKLITPGMSIADVTNTFGLPGSAIQVTENMILLTYMFPFEVKKQEEGPYLTGFGIDIKDGRVIRWSPVTGMTGKTTQGGGSQGSLGEQSFQIFLVTDSLTNVVNTIESEGSADAGSLKASPDMAFIAQVFAGISGSERPGERTVILVVSQQDASKLKDLSENNFGKRLLIVCRNHVIAAPAITAPLASRQLLFTVKDSRVLDSIQNK
jgi:hypothetical protein